MLQREILISLSCEESVIAQMKSPTLPLRSVWAGLTLLIMGLASPGIATASSPAPTQTNPGSILRNLLGPGIPPLTNPDQFLPLNRLYQKRIVLRLSERRVYLYQGEQELASYPVAVGKPGWETPTGTFEVIMMIENPSWQNPWTGEVRPPGPESALGLRWIGFWSNGKDTIGFHGTPTIESIGQAASHGCVRMHNEDVVALFEQVEMGTTVIVEP
jgi:lipoprotein-anchoring transpeptidase ErfK/SrfK